MKRAIWFTAIFWVSMIAMAVWAGGYSLVGAVNRLNGSMDAQEPPVAIADGRWVDDVVVDEAIRARLMADQLRAMDERLRRVEAAVAGRKP